MHITLPFHHHDLSDNVATETNIYNTYKSLKDRHLYEFRTCACMCANYTKVHKN